MIIVAFLGLRAEMKKNIKVIQNYIRFIWMVMIVSVLTAIYFLTITSTISNESKISYENLFNHKNVTTLNYLHQIVSLRRYKISHCSLSISDFLDEMLW
jgi:hypothetical protein